jgi:hypothetical protein
MEPGLSRKMSVRKSFLFLEYGRKANVKLPLINRKCKMKKNNALKTFSAHIILFFIASPGIYVKRIFLSHWKELILIINRICSENTSINY